jgi:multiple sugar transport system permease protein
MKKNELTELNVSIPKPFAQSVRWAKYLPYLLFLPALLVLAVMFVYPFFSNIYISFLDYTLTQQEKPFIFLKNYIEVVQSRYFVEILVRTVIWTVANLFFLVLLGLTTSMLLMTKFIGKGLLQACLLIPWVLPEIVTGYTWKWMLTSDYGIVNTTLDQLGLLSADFSWFSNGTMALIAVIIANVWRAFPFMTLMFYAKLKTMPNERIEAARIDGASSLQIFWHITLNFLRPIIERCSLLAFIWTFGSFSIIYTLTGGGPIGKTETFPYIIQKTAFTEFAFGKASAISIIMFIIILIVLLFGFALAKLANPYDEDKE